MRSPRSASAPSPATPFSNRSGFERTGIRGCAALLKSRPGLTDLGYRHGTRAPEVADAEDVEVGAEGRPRGAGGGAGGAAALRQPLLAARLHPAPALRPAGAEAVPPDGLPRPGGARRRVAGPRPPPPAPGGGALLEARPPGAAAGGPRGEKRGFPPRRGPGGDPAPRPRPAGRRG